MTRLAFSTPGQHARGDGHQDLGWTHVQSRQSYVVPWTEISFNDVYSSDIRLRTTIFSGVNEAWWGGGQLHCLLSVSHEHSTTTQHCGHSS